MSMPSKLEIAKATIAVHECSVEIEELNSKLLDFDDVNISEDNESDIEVEKTKINNELTELLSQFHRLSILENQLIARNTTQGGAHARQEIEHQAHDHFKQMTAPKLSHVQNSINDQPNSGSVITRSSSRLLQLAKPPSFTAEKGDSISTFLEKFHHFITLGNIKDPNLDLYLLNLVKDPKTYRKLRSIKLNPEQKGDIDLLISAIKTALVPDSEIRSIRSELSSLKQACDESIEDFAYRVEELSSRGFCNENMREEGALSAFLEGVRDISIKQKLLESDTANTFAKATRLAFKLDKISNTLKLQSTPDDHSVLHISQDQNQGQRPSSYPSTGFRRQDWSTIRCYTCKLLGHGFRRCPNNNNPDNNRQERRVTFSPHNTSSRNPTPNSQPLNYQPARLNNNEQLHSRRSSQ